MENTRDQLKNKFKKGDKPTEVDYADLIDSFVNKSEDPYFKFNELPDAKTTAKGIVEQATITEAEAGVDDTRFVTPLGVQRSVAKFAPVPPVTSVNGKTGVITIPDYTVATVWQNISLRTNVTKIGAAPRYGIKSGIVFLEGEITINSTTSGNTALFTLGVGHQPQRTIIFYVTGSTGTMVKIQINTTGAVVATNISSGTTLSISISGVSFIAK